MPPSAEQAADFPPIVLAFAASDPSGGARSRADLLTPNSTEARRLADGEDDEEPSLALCAQRLIESGCGHVLITGTHEATAQVVNTLYGKAGLVRSDSWERLPGSYHGSGCTLASAIAATLANGLELPEAGSAAPEYTRPKHTPPIPPPNGHHTPPPVSLSPPPPYHPLLSICPHFL